jgi:hypothetical protein
MLYGRFVPASQFLVCRHEAFTTGKAGRKLVRALCMLWSGPVTQWNLKNMNQEKPPPSPVTDRGVRVALIFALTAERLNAYYEHRQWLTEAQGATLAADWLARSKRSRPDAERRSLSALSDQLARQIEASVAREVGLHITHEMMESLDSNYQSEVGLSLMVECERLLDAGLTR